MNEIKCPQCSETKLTKRDYKGTPVDICEGCGGLWLDKGELNKVAHPIQGDLEFCSREHADKQSQFTELECPNCPGKKLLKAKFIEFTDITLDHCPKCDGIWLNKGELDAINTEIDSLTELPESWDHRIMAFLSKLPF
jgi:uncharacterized protein